jgi:hypothetical protein
MIQWLSSEYTAIYTRITKKKKKKGNNRKVSHIQEIGEMLESKE